MFIQKTKAWVEVEVDKALAGNIFLQWVTITPMMRIGLKITILPLLFHGQATSTEAKMVHGFAQQAKVESVLVIELLSTLRFPALTTKLNSKFERREMPTSQIGWHTAPMPVKMATDHLAVVILTDPVLEVPTISTGANPIWHTFMFLFQDLVLFFTKPATMKTNQAFGQLIQGVTMNRNHLRWTMLLLQVKPTLPLLAIQTSPKVDFGVIQMM
jgi:hypothetical protein